jgi:hypothetical protein
VQRLKQRIAVLPCRIVFGPQIDEMFPDTRGWRQERGEHLNGCALGGSVRAKQAKHLAAYLKRTSLRHRSAADLIDRRISVTDVISQSPGHEKALAPRVFHFNRHAIASGVFDLKHHSIDQALAAKVFNLDHHTIEQVPASRVVHLNRNNLAPRVFHLNHHVVWQSHAPKRFFSELR